MGHGTHTNSDRFDPYAFLDVCICVVVTVLSLQDLLAAEGIYKGGTTWMQTKRISMALVRTTRLIGVIVEQGMKLSVGVLPVPEAPQTIRQNWIPFLTFFFLRICRDESIVSGLL